MVANAERADNAEKPSTGIKEDHAELKRAV